MKLLDSKTITVAIVALMAIAAVPLITAEDTDADANIMLTDGRGVTVTLNEPAAHIATLGKGLTLTAIDLGFVDSIVVCDKYSIDRNNDKFAQLVKNYDDKKTHAEGSLYSDTGWKQFCSELYYAAGDSEKAFDREKDIVMIAVSAKSDTASGQNALKIENNLKEYGFKNVLIWFEITEYSHVIKMVEQVSLALTGEKGELAEQMAYTAEYIADKLDGREKTKAFYVTWTENMFKVGNYGALATSMLIAAGANVVTLDPSINKTTYPTNLPTLVAKYDFPIVFADNTIKNDNMKELEKEVGESRIIPLNPLWNNFDPESQEGLWVMACALYPDLFEGDVPEVPKSDDPNLVLYAGIAIGAVAIVGIIGFLFMRGKH